MYIILLDSSDVNLSVGIAKDGAILETISYEAWQRQSEYMIPELYKLMQKYDVKKEDIEAVMVAKGPGSYTGVRIAITIAKTIATALNIKLYAISSLRVLKDGTRPSICLINARSGRSYFGVFEGDKIIIEDCIIKNDDLLAYIKDHPDYSICGKTTYLGIEGKETNNLVEMLSLKDALEDINPLSLRPVYMKD